MSRLKTPLKYRTLWITGDVLVRAELEFLLKDAGGVWKLRRFLVDFGSEITTMPAYEAKRLGLLIPQRPSLGVVHQPTGVEIRSGVLVGRVVGMDATEYVFPCFFLGDPDTPLDPTKPQATIPRNLLGLAGVVDKLRLTFDGDAGPGAVYCHLIVEIR